MHDTMKVDKISFIKLLISCFFSDIVQKTTYHTAVDLRLSALRYGMIGNPHTPPKSSAGLLPSAANSKAVAASGILAGNVHKQHGISRILWKATGAVDALFTDIRGVLKFMCPWRCLHIPPTSLRRSHFIGTWSKATAMH